MDQRSLLDANEGAPVKVLFPNAASAVVIACEHASNTLPRALGDMGLDPAARNSHIAWDPGALALAEFMGQALDATVVAANFSRLAYDCNRPPDADAAMPAQSEIFSIPGNQALSATARQARVAALYDPFHAALGHALAARGPKAVLVTMHSFTPVYFGKPRAVELGILHDDDSRLADAMLALAPAFTGLKCERNQPYGAIDGVTHTLQRHAIAQRLLNVMIEVRNDTIADDAQQKIQADMLAQLVTAALHQINAAGL